MYSRSGTYNKQVSGALEKSRAETYVGTLYYMAPERVLPNTDKHYTVTADIWSLGVTLVELVTGKYPYPRDPFVFVSARFCRITVVIHAHCFSYTSIPLPTHCVPATGNA